MDVFLSVLLGNLLQAMIIPTAALNLTSFPSTATEGEPFTLMCTSNFSMGSESLSWFMDGSLLFFTNMGGLTVSNPNTFNNVLHLEERLTVDTTSHQHNVTINISSHFDVGTRWKCWDVIRDKTSNEVPIRISTLSTIGYRTSSLTFNTISKGTEQDISTTVIDTTPALSPNVGSNDCPKSSSLDVGVGVGIGVAGMLMLDGVCLLLVFLYKRRVTTCLSGGGKEGKPDISSSNDQESVTMAVPASHTVAGGDYEMPGNFYEGLQTSSVQAPSLYDKLTVYQNT